MEAGRASWRANLEENEHRAVCFIVAASVIARPDRHAPSLHHARAVGHAWGAVWTRSGHGPEAQPRRACQDHQKRAAQQRATYHLSDSTTVKIKRARASAWNRARCAHLASAPRGAVALALPLRATAGFQRGARPRGGRSEFSGRLDAGDIQLVARARAYRRHGRFCSHGPGRSKPGSPDGRAKNLVQIP